ncbi:MAG: hypothetical protein ISS82_01585 [Nanoarchaeota archaeon]|nr:hypothetical protein [Nanoarchaeota archaeon]
MGIDQCIDMMSKVHTDIARRETDPEYAKKAEESDKIESMLQNKFKKEIETIESLPYIYGIAGMGVSTLGGFIPIIYTVGWNPPNAAELVLTGYGILLGGTLVSGTICMGIGACIGRLKQRGLGKKINEYLY